MCNGIGGSRAIFNRDLFLFLFPLDFARIWRCIFLGSVFHDFLKGAFFTNFHCIFHNFWGEFLSEFSKFGGALFMLWGCTFHVIEDEFFTSFMVHSSQFWGWIVHDFEGTLFTLFPGAFSQHFEGYIFGIRQSQIFCLFADEHNHKILTQQYNNCVY